jgi:DivIVA domain-containing protein
VTVDGDTTDTSEATEPTQTPETADAEHPEPPPVHLSAERLCDYVQRASFTTHLGRRGYQQVEVDALLGRIVESLRAGEPLADLVRHTHLTHVRLEDGYDHGQVDDFLAAVLDLDPHADPARPEIARGGLIAKLFG